MTGMQGGKRNIVQAIDEDDQAQAGNDLAENDNPDSPLHLGEIQRDLNFQTSPIPCARGMQRQNSQANAIGGREDQENGLQSQHETSF